MQSPIKTGLMAYGMSGRVFHAPFIYAHQGFELSAVVERHEKKAAERYPYITSYNQSEELLNDRRIGLIIVNTPNNTHFDLAKRSLRAGKHVLVEKPIAATVTEVKELYDLSRQVNKHLMVYQNRRWDSDFLSVKEAIESGRLGQLIEVHFRFDRYKATLSPKQFKETKSMRPNGLAYDLGPHLIDQVISLFGRPLKFTKTTATYREGSQVDDYFHFHLSYPNQLNVYLTSGLLIAQPTPSFVVHGTLGSYIKDRVDVQEAQLDKGIPPTDPAYGIEPKGSEGKLVTFDENNQKITELVSSCKGQYFQLFEAIYQTIRNGALYPITEEHIAWQIELLEA
ncbi:Gfo/Idh/MocA family oxidoreductase [Mucilaginibacter sp. BT774]|uniref:Gfo/Idh/MocA family oxidoreductase n=1 Tax=Mucilaginibacter sp. BT774 TaxID=3062276 RepID=UPI0026752494|nr:Gfo/Idh/MocA family oxidoreductase [Mucilaginibacter sp. BT774]MDO3627056.1 Gfo/Idh/MocA family oxidoreductase [Mucilaginibacter sp. BT774]